MRKMMNAFFLSSLLLLASCSTKNDNANSDQLAQKKAQLEDLKSQQKKLADDITSLESEIQKLDPSSKVEKSKLVAVAAIIPANFTHYIDLQGSIQAEDISYIAPRNGQGGLVKSLFIKKGDVVKKGQKILKLDDAVCLKNVQLLQTQLTYAEHLLRRQQNLWDQQIGTELQLIQAKQNVDQIKDQMATVKEQWNTTNVYSDVDGVADEVNLRVGELFTGYVGQSPQIKIVNNSRLKVITQVPENYIDKVKTGSSMVVSLPDVGKTFNSQISLSGKIIDPNSRSFYVEAKMPSDKDIRPNQIALVKIQDYTAANAITIPVNTLQNDDKGKFVMVAVNENGKNIARKKQVQIGELYGDKLEIKAGLQSGDQVITEGFQGLYDGRNITLTATN